MPNECISLYSSSPKSLVPSESMGVIDILLFTYLSHSYAESFTDILKIMYQ